MTLSGYEHNRLGERDLQGCFKIPVFSLSSIRWRRGLGRGGLFFLVFPSP